MTDDNGFVERPTERNYGPDHSGRTIASRLRLTVENGKAVLIKRTTAGGHRQSMKAQGFRLLTTQHGAPEGMLYAWCERRTEPAP